MNTVSPDFITALRDATVVAPELPEAAAFDTLNQLIDCERTMVGRSAEGPFLMDYVQGSATQDDEVAVFGATNYGTVVSADHATDPFKRSIGTHIRGDHGTGGLALLLAERAGVTSIVPLGRQTWNVAVATDDHPIKRTIGRLLPGRHGFVSLHGMLPGKLLELSDTTEIHGLIGLGANPSELSRRTAEAVVRAAGDLGLRVLVGNDTIHRTFDSKSGGFALDATGQPKEGQLKAHRVDMTTNYAYRVMEQTGRQVPSLQIELTRMLRLLPADLENGWHVDRKAQAMGVYLGWLLAKSTVEIISAQNGSGKVIQ